MNGRLELVAAFLVGIVVATTSLVRALADAQARARTTRRLLRGAPGASVPPAVVLVAVVGGTVAVLTVGPVLVVVVAAGAVAARRVVAAYRRHREPERAADELADVVDAFARALRTGSPPTDAVRVAATSASRPVAEGFAAVAASTERGLPLALAFERWSTTSVIDGADLVATAVVITATAGGDRARALLGVADTLRDRRSLRREVRALASQARLSAAVIAVAPVAFAVVAAATDSSTADVLLRSPLGAGCLAGGLGLDVAGWWWMDRITRSVT